MGELLLPSAGPAGAGLPVRGVLPEVVLALQRTGTAVLVAPPGSGKTSLLPLALADAWPGQVIVAEPRRIATRAAACRMADLVGEQPGGRIGYAMRGDRRVSRRTRVEVVTTGLLVRRLQHDPALDGVSAVIVDEVHERALDTDLALAFCLDVRANLRPDLPLVATSATPDTDRLAAVLGRDGAPAQIVTAGGVIHPVQILFAPPPRPIPLLPDARVDPKLLDHVAAVVRRALAEGPGDVLVFLPGEAEITAVARLLADLDNVLPLFGRQSAADQDRALQPANSRRVVLSTAVAESSLTVPGVFVVVDAGLSREPRVDHSRGLGTLTTTRVSRSSAAQRAGRAGREGPGRVYRCWSEADDRYLAGHRQPEIATSDLTGFALAVADWGHPGGHGLALMDDPPAAAMTTAVAALQALQALDDDGRITDRGRRLALVAATPRLARALLDGAELVGGRRAAEIVALLSGDGPAGRTDDLVQRWRELRAGRDAAATTVWRAEVARLCAGGSSPTARRELAGQQVDARETAGRQVAGRKSVGDDLAAATVVGLAFPERLARLRAATGTDGGRNYLMAGGTGAVLSPATGLLGSPWLAIAVADRPAGNSDARIRLAAPLDAATAASLGAALFHREHEIAWRDGRLVLRQHDRLGAIPLAERPLADPDQAAVEAAVRDGLRVDGLEPLDWSPAADRLRRRMALLHRVLGEPWPDVCDSALLDSLEAWLGPDLHRVHRAADLARIDTGSALRRLLPRSTASWIDELAPERLPVPSGSMVRVDYSGVDHSGDGSPVLAVKVQEAFGWQQAPVLAGGRLPVVLHLLSPAGRPAAITSDLTSFWRQGYPQVRAELRSRYPRHAWPDDPLTAAPSRRPAGRTSPNRSVPD